MGYTHYWTFKAPTKVKGNADIAENRYQTAISECAKIARTWNAECKTEGRDDERLSGFTAHTKPGKYGGLEINGKAENSHEPFTMREHFRENFENDAFNFCKTARKPYDIVVTACLAVLKHRLGDLIDVRSDGDAQDWTNGIGLARRITGLAIKSPIKTEIEEIEEIEETNEPINSMVHPITGTKYLEAATLVKALKQAKTLGADLDFVIKNIEALAK